MTSLSGSTREAAVLQAMVPSLEAEGFEVFLRPTKIALPPFLEAHRPDAIAVKGDRKVAIEVARAGSRARLELLERLFSDHQDWELRVVYAPPPTLDMPIEALSRDLIEDHLDRAERAYDVAGSVAGLLTAWSSFEAAARSLAPDALARPQPSARLIDVLGAEGYVTPDEADLLRAIARLRNEAAHGRLNAAFPKSDLDALIEITRLLLDQRSEATRLV